LMLNSDYTNPVEQLFRNSLHKKIYTDIDKKTGLFKTTT